VQYAYICCMNALRQWLNQEGTAGRKRLFAALKLKRPTITQASISDYSLDKRVPTQDIARIISDVTGIPVSLIPYRYLNEPGLSEGRK
jgi:hypothetical protein